MSTKIEWVKGPDGRPGKTWNPASGCSKSSKGCTNCYGEAMARRFNKDWRPWTKGNAVHNVRTRPKRFRDPFRWYEPRRVFTCSTGDLFHERLSHGFVMDVFGIMGAAWWHSFMVLTKRPERMRRVLTMCAYEINQRVLRWTHELFNGPSRAKTYARLGLPPWPLPNVWPGTSVEDQRTADERIPPLLQTPAAVRFISAEPLLGPIDLASAAGVTYWDDPSAGIRWVIVGGESGPKARPVDLDWFRDLRDQCREAGVPYFLKQLGTHWARKVGAKSYKGSDPEEWPEDLRVRELVG